MHYSKLKNDLEMLELQQKHELEMIKLKHQNEKQLLLKQCNHTYDDGASARVTQGVQWDYWYECSICGKTV